MSMNISQAIESAKLGKAVRREGWAWFGVTLEYRRGGAGVEPFLVIVDANGSRSVYTPSQDDLFAGDWETL